VEIGVLFVDFSDSPARDTTEAVLMRFSPNVENLFESMSYGRLSIELKPVHGWLRMQKESALYRAGGGDWCFVCFLQMLEEIIRVGTQGINTSRWESFILIADSKFVDTTAFSPSPDWKIEAGGRSWANGVVLGGSALNQTPSIFATGLAHELGHTFGLPDLYPYNGVGFRYTGNFGLMGNIYESVIELFAWERWLLSWLDDTQVVCLNGREVKAVLNPVSVFGGQKMIVIPLSDTRALVVEVRRRGGFDEKLSKEGPLAYVVDTNQQNGYGGIKIVPINEDDWSKSSAPLDIGKTIEFEGITISYLSRSTYGDEILVFRS
jgi:M6 family metalloprotease-like protein